MSPEPVAPSPEIREAAFQIDQALQLAAGIRYHVVDEDRISRLEPILTRLYLAAKIEGKREASIDLQRWLRHPGSCFVGTVHYPSGKITTGNLGKCICGLVDTLAKLREEAK